MPDAPAARIHFLASEVYADQKDATSAKRERDLGLETELVSDLDWVARGNSLGRDDPAAAVSAYDEALQINPESLLALRNKALALARMPGHEQASVDVLDKALEIYPEAAALRTSRGLFLARMGQRDRAAKDAEECVRLDPRPSTFYSVANIYAMCARSHSEDAKRAVGNLAIALRGGFGAEFVEKDPDLDPIRTNPDFKQVVSSARTLQEAAKRAGTR